MWKSPAIVPGVYQLVQKEQTDGAPVRGHVLDCESGLKKKGLMAKTENQPLTLNGML